MAKNKASKGGNQQTLQKVLHYIRRYWFLVIASLLCASGTVVLTLYTPILTGRAVDLILAPGQVDFDGILAILRTTAILLLITALLQWIMNICNNNIT